MTLSAYLNFSGNCEEAFAFYARLFKTEVAFTMKYGESPMAGEFGAGMADKVMHVRLVADGQVLMGSDSPSERYKKPTGTCVTIGVETAEEAERIYAGLADGADVQMELQETFWATRFGMLVDRFGTPWMVNCEKRP